MAAHFLKPHKPLLAETAGRILSFVIVAGFLLFPATCGEASGPHSIFASPGDAVAISHTGHHGHHHMDRTQEHHHTDGHSQHEASPEPPTIDGFGLQGPKLSPITTLDDGAERVPAVRDVPETDSAVLIAIQAAIVEEGGPAELSEPVKLSSDSLVMSGWTTSPDSPPPR